MRRALIACGGTGGHLAPGIALAEALVSQDWECTLIISNKQVDSRLVKKYSQFGYEAVDGRPFSGNPVRLLLFCLSLIKGTLRCRRMIRDHGPDLVIGFGGFLSMPAMLAGFLSGLPTVIHEANRVPGRVTRIVSRFARRIYLPRGVSLRSKKESRIRYLGMPVRREISRTVMSKAKSELGLDPSRKVLLIMGGSQGAEALNNWVKSSLPALAEREVQVYCLTGSSEKDCTLAHKSSKGFEVRAIFRGFSHDMATVLSAADLVVSRSGAGSIAEMIRCRVPGILVPYPYSADDHQVANAQEFERLGCGVHMPQGDLDSLLGRVMGAICDEDVLQGYRRNLEAADCADVESFMVADLEQIVSGEGLDVARDNGKVQTS